ncbi:TetR/AcrR family transcriptional regulator [Streptomyces sp. NPDC088745]|uniref:TetR/AcrR family transcriptional regulator n=1 Tax=Streptomyces sp. NPDC088745 TaxID=3365884 RepID=UPI00380690AC
MTARTSPGFRETPAHRADRVADAALKLLVERGMRGLTHRAVDETAGLPQGSTSNCARTRQALLELAVRRLAVVESEALGVRSLPGSGPGDGPGPGPGPGLDQLVDLLADTLHRYLTEHRSLLIARYELGLEATRRPELREFYDATGRAGFQGPLIALMTAAGSREPERHTLSLVAWVEGLMYSCAAGSYHASVPTRAELRTGFGELLRGMLGG